MVVQAVAVFFYSSKELSNTARVNRTFNVALKSVSKGVLSILGSVPLPRYPSTSTGWGQDLHSVNAQMRVTERGREEDRWPGEHDMFFFPEGSITEHLASLRTLMSGEKNGRPTCLGSRRKFAAWLISISLLSWTAGTAVYFHQRFVLITTDMSTEIIMIYFGKTHWELNACFFLVLQLLYVTHALYLRECARNIVRHYWHSVKVKPVVFRSWWECVKLAALRITELFHLSSGQWEGNMLKQW